ncbi:MAG TPA: hypothetical protein VNR64_19105 [Vicinamibacterales bacterium]|nr:hypothetical protein [Vicinamibacterales bacterium]
MSFSRRAAPLVRIVTLVAALSSPLIALSGTVWAASSIPPHNAAFPAYPLLAPVRPVVRLLTTRAATRLRNVPSGAFTLRAQRIGYAAQERAVTVNGNHTVDVLIARRDAWRLTRGAIREQQRPSGFAAIHDAAHHAPR